MDDATSSYANTCRIAALFLILLAARATQGQGVPKELNTGYPENSIFHGSEIDNVQLQNGNLHVTIPIWSAKGRGLNTGFNFVYDNHGYRFTTHCYTGGGGFCQDTVTVDPLSPMVLTGLGPLDYQFSTPGGGSQLCSNNLGAQTFVYTLGNFFLREPDGTKHHFSPDPVATNIEACGQVMQSTVYADDGSGWTMKLDLTNGEIVSATNKNGTIYGNTSGSKIVDANGNEVAWNSGTNTIYDTLGRVVPANGSYYDSSGTLQSLAITAPNGIPTQITLPNNQGTYTFTYAPTIPTQLCQFSAADQCFESSNGGGEIASITLPTGGQISYAWGIWDRGGRRVASRTVSANGVTGTWNYQYPTDASAIVTDPSGKDMESTSSVVSSINGPCFTTAGETLQYFDGAAGSSPLIKTVQTDYNCQLAVVWNSHIPLPIRVTTTWNQQNLVSKVETDWDLKPVAPGISTFTWKNPIERREYGWGTGAPGALVRRTHSSYRHLESDGQNYLNANIADLPTLVQTYDGAGYLAAQTQNYYDGSALTSTGSCGSGGAPGHDYCSFGTNNLVRGNVMQVSRWLNTTNSWLNTTHTYDDLGNVLSTTDPLQHSATISYTDNWSGSSCVAATNTFAFPTLVTDALQHRNKAAYYPCTSLVQSKQEENDLRAGRNGTTFTYDLLNRPLVTTFPDGGQTTYSYNDAVPMTITTTVKASPDPDITSIVRLDGLGRSSQTQLVSDPQGTVFTDVTYDSLGRRSTVSNPYRSTADPTYGITTNKYDLLSRVTGVVPPDGNVTTLANSVITAYSGNSTTVTDQAGKQRRSFSDALGRLIEVDEPAGGTPATSGSGSATVNGSEQSVGGTGATPGSGSVTISGSEASTEIDPCYNPDIPPPSPSCPRTIWDRGTVSVTVNGFTESVSYGSADTPSTIASALAAAFSGAPSSPATASASGAVITLTAKATGSATNYSLSASSATNDPTDFGGPSFTPVPSGVTLTGGANGGPPVYDSGSIWVTVNGTQCSTSYGQNSTATALASSLASAINTCSSVVTASASGTTITLTAKTTGAATNYSLSSGSSTSQPGSFASPSFTVSVSAAALTGGSDAYPPSLGTPAVTLYTYDALNNLTCVAQKGTDTSAFTNCASAPATWRPRSFAYDSLSRLTNSTNPESGTITYTYNNDSVVLSKTDARGITTNYDPSDGHIDALHRVTKVTYSNGEPSIFFGYDGVATTGCTPPALTINNGVGRRTSMCDAAGAEAWSYDITSGVGWKTTDVRITNSVSKTSIYQNNLAGSTKTLAYPSGRTVTYTNNAAGQPVSAVDNSNVSYASAALYAPTGSLSSLTNGSSIVSTFYYNTRLQPCRISVKSSGSAPGSCTDTANIGNVLDFNYNFSLGTANNGNVTSIANNRDTTRSQSFTYDALNRIAAAQTSSTFSTSPQHCWGESFTYDAWGNLLTIGGATGYTGCSQESGFNFTNLTTTKNQISGYGYDAAGNMTSVPGIATYTYNAENQLVTTAGVTYTYDGDGKRVQKSSGKLYWYGMGSDPITESDASGNITNEYIFFVDKRIAKRDSTGNVDYYFADHLGTARVVTNSAGTVLDDSDFYAFGGERAYLSSSGNNYKFTSKERDSESGNDDFEARYYGSNFGRFISPDAPLVGQYVSEPQSWNAYGYVRGNPTNATDPDGRDCVFTLGDHAYVARGTCADLPENAQHATYVAGTVDARSATYDPLTGTLSFSYTPYSASEGGSGASLGRGIITGVFPPSGVSDTDRFNAVAQGMQMAEPGVSLAANGLRAFGYIAGGPLLPIAECLAGDPGCSKSGLALSLIPGLKGLKLLGLGLKEERAIAGVLKQIADGTTKGKEFLNAAGQLPAKAAGYYREFTVPVAGQAGRGAARLVTGAGGEVYYTADHYTTFTKIK
jgi:RHS repeat-associated protein